MSKRVQWATLRARLQSWTGNLMADDGMRSALDALSELAAERGETVDQFLVAADSSSDAPERQALIDRLLIRTTWFMREPEAVGSLTARLDAQAREFGDRSVSIWSVACSTGEEPYSLAISALEAKLVPSILATDVSPAARNAAARAEYASERLLNLPQPWRDRYFEKAGSSTVRVTREVRRCVRFMPYNLLDSTCIVPGWGTFHAVVCRNVLIYWAPEAAEDVLHRLMAACRPEGFLLLGAAEQALARGLGHLAPDEQGGWLLKRTARPPSGQTQGANAGPVPRHPTVSDIELTPPLEVLRPFARPPTPPAVPKLVQTEPHPARPAPTAEHAELIEADRLLTSGDTAAAVARLQEAAARNPTSGAVRLWLGRALKAAGKLDEAIQEFRAARGLMPDSSWLAPYQLAVCLDQRRMYREALEAYRHAISVIEQAAPSGLGVADAPEEHLVRTVITSCRQRVTKLARLTS